MGEVKLKKKSFYPWRFFSSIVFYHLTLLSENSRLLIPEVGLDPFESHFWSVLKEMNADIEDGKH